MACLAYAHCREVGGLIAANLREEWAGGDRREERHTREKKRKLPLRVAQATSPSNLSPDFTRQIIQGGSLTLHVLIGNVSVTDGFLFSLSFCGPLISTKCKLDLVTGTVYKVQHV